MYLPDGTSSEGDLVLLITIFFLSSYCAHVQQGSVTNVN